MTPHPDSCPDKLSELAILTQGTAGIPTVIPTKCLDTARRPPCSAESRQASRRNGGITGARRDRRDSIGPTPESRHQSRHAVAIILAYSGLFATRPSDRLVAGSGRAKSSPGNDRLY